MKSLDLPWINFEFTFSFRESTFNSISFFANSFSIQYLTSISLTIPFEFSSLWIHHLFSEFTLNSRIHLQFIFFFAISFANPLRIHFLFREFTLNSLFCVNWLTISFESNSLWIHYLPLSISRVDFQFTIYLLIDSWLMIFFNWVISSLWIDFESFIFFANALSI